MLRRLPLHDDPTGAVDPQVVDPDELDVVLAAESRPRPPDRPWVVVNMVTSADGATYVDGVSGPLGAEGDTAVFMALRSIADVILAGSATVTAERYRPPRAKPARRSRREERGQSPLPRLAVISNRGNIDLSLPMFSDPQRRPLVLTSDDIVPARRQAIEEVADVILVGSPMVDPARAIRALGDATGASVVLCEGGATLNGLLIEADLIDEWCITVAPVLAGGRANRAAIGPSIEHLRHMRLDRVFEQGGELMTRYVRDPDAAGGR